MHLELEPKKSVQTESQNTFLHNSEPNRVGFAVVGLGDYSLANILPAFDWCENARLSAVVSANEARAHKVAREHELAPNSVYTFEDFDRIKNNREVQVVYISLRGDLRDQMILRAARAGKHIICDARFSGDAKVDQKIAKFCEEAGVKLIMTYRRAGFTDGLTVLRLDHMANCILKQRTPARLSEALRGFQVPKTDVARWAN